MKKIIYYEIENIENLIKITNEIKMPILENAEKLFNIKKILETGMIGEVEANEDVVEQQKVCKN